MTGEESREKREIPPLQGKPARLGHGLSRLIGRIAQTEVYATQCLARRVKRARGGMGGGLFCLGEEEGFGEGSFGGWAIGREVVRENAVDE